MTINKRPNSGGDLPPEPSRFMAGELLPHAGGLAGPEALQYAMETKDFERAALILLVRAMSIEQGTIEDVIAVLAEAEAWEHGGA